MKKNQWLVLIVLVLICLSGALRTTYSVKAAFTLPEKVRVGLYYYNSRTKANTATASFKASANLGLRVGFEKDNTFNVLYEEATNNFVTIMKDAYYVKNNNVYTEYNQADKNIPQGDRVGPFHVQIGEILPDRAAALEAVNSYKLLGIEAYPVFVDGWKVWSGFFVDQTAAESEIAFNLINIIPNQPMTVISPSDQRILVLSGSGSVLLAYESGSNHLKIQSIAAASQNLIKINNDSKKTYRGELEVRRIKGSDMTVVNIVSLEEYIYGVVPDEIGSSSHIEALKAQAVSARTYTLSNINKHSTYGFNLCNSQCCQVYGGTSKETEKTNQAIDATKGKILTFNGNPAQVFYFSSSGGMTEDAKNVWNSDLPYLKSVEDKYESGKSWHYNWEITYTAEKVKQILIGKGHNIGDILSIGITKFAPSGRAIELSIKGSTQALPKVFKNEECRTGLSLDSQWYTITSNADVVAENNTGSKVSMQLGGKSVMTASGLQPIKSSSSNVSIVSAGDVKKSVPLIATSYKFVGKGWGHAVGMSQEGARGMANAGFTYEQILTHYFQGTKVE